jgi:peptide/nickel transport system permease protein
MSAMIWVQDGLVVLGVIGLILLGRLLFSDDRSKRAWKRMRRNRLGLISAAVVLGYGVVALLDTVAVPDAGRASGRASLIDLLFAGVPNERGYSAPLAETTFGEFEPEHLAGWHLLGTDLLGKDVLRETLKGCRTALLIGGVTSLFYIPVGALLGIAAGFYRKRVDDVVQYLYSTVASIPGILLLIAVLMVLGKGLDRMALALSLTAWVGLCRLVRGETMRQASRPYVEAARAIGQSGWRIVVRHILPNVMHLVVINFVLGFSGLVLAEAILSYLGVGAPVGTPSWGIMIDAGRMELSREPMVWWNLAAATGAVFLLVLSLNLLGDALRRAFDPKSS